MGWGWCSELSVISLKRRLKNRVELQLSANHLLQRHEPEVAMPETADNGRQRKGIVGLGAYVHQDDIAGTGAHDPFTADP